MSARGRTTRAARRSESLGVRTHFARHAVPRYQSLSQSFAMQHITSLQSNIGRKRAALAGTVDTQVQKLICLIVVSGPTCWPALSFRAVQTSRCICSNSVLTNPDVFDC